MRDLSSPRSLARRGERGRETKAVMWASCLTTMAELTLKVPGGGGWSRDRPRSRLGSCPRRRSPMGHGTALRPPGMPRYGLWHGPKRGNGRGEVSKPNQTNLAKGVQPGAAAFRLVEVSSTTFFGTGRMLSRAVGGGADHQGPGGIQIVSRGWEPSSARFSCVTVLRS